MDRQPEGKVSFEEAIAAFRKLSPARQESIIEEMMLDLARQQMHVIPGGGAAPPIASRPVLSVKRGGRR